jgi:ADP-heptose:LPS heptosyltransferase
VRHLRRQPFDLLISQRPDPREVMMARLLGSREYAGLAAMGGTGWISVDLGAELANPGLDYDGAVSAAAAKALLGVEVSPQPRFRRLARRAATRQPVLAVSFGASHPIKRWNKEGIADALARVTQKPTTTLVIGHDHSPTVRLPEGWERQDWQGSLPELKALLAGIDVLFCSDSGVMHIAAAAGCQVVALFTTGSLSRFGPMGHRLYAVEPMPCRPCGDYCIHPTLRCVEGIEAATVAMLVDDALKASGPPTDVRKAPSGTL